ncbi:cation:dicarboxylase symporter family transporter [Conexibacter sp. JD483]|uniref:cation:dicarboxylate symporter family transporter n=1 Tax=unclassified Conexibacter TaxID=2627773 RepID=UPI0027271A51|nr:MULTISPECIES: cation:dicarboxylase symporter family transporter [unclassified Conexibacter]MDO8185664.1 cation:dicarboxylase symporter family transporter [Conexibacter sp. CPCC 205706]MDR9372806.1 cation:dicarboxylase symporter family transporter [Conexibacter sp. JD483]
MSWVAIWFLRKRNLNFSLIALFALAVGVPIGLVAKEHVDAIAPIGTIYINVLLATVAPLILIAIISAITSLDSLAKLRSIGLRSIFWLLLSNALAVVLALGLALTFQPGKGVGNQLGGLSTDAVQGQVQTFSQVVVDFFPSNVVQNFGANDIIPIILIAVVLGVAYLAIAEKELAQVRIFRDGAEALKLVIFKAVGYVIRLTPYAVVALTAHMVGSSSNLGDAFKSLLGLLALVWVACFIHMYLVNAAILKAFADVPIVPFFRKIFPAQLTAFSTQSSVGTLPVTTARLTRQVGVHSEIAHFTAPLGSTIGMPGCSGIWPIMVAVWGINAYGLHYTLGDYALLALLGVIVSVGTAGVPGAATVAAATVLSAANLPLEFVAATIPISIIADMARTSTNVTAAAVSATVVARQTGLLDDDIFDGRVEFYDDDELSESEVVGNGAHNGAYPGMPPAGAYPGLPAPAWPQQQPVGAHQAVPVPYHGIPVTWPRYVVPYEGVPDPAWQPPANPAPHHPRVYWGADELAVADEQR